MGSEQPDSAVRAIAKWAGANFDPPWTDYIGQFHIDDAVERRLVEVYCKTGSPARFGDIDLARLNLRRALCQLRRVEVVQATLDDPTKRFHRTTDFILICGYLGPVIFPILVENYEADEAKDAQKHLVLQSIAQILVQHRDASALVADKLNYWLAAFAMQDRLLNGLLIEVAKLIEEPPQELAEIVGESGRLTLYFDDQQRLSGPSKPVTLFPR